MKNVYDLDEKSLFQYMTKLVPDISVFDMIENEYYKEDKNFSNSFFYYDDFISEKEIPNYHIKKKKISVKIMNNENERNYWYRYFFKINAETTNNVKKIFVKNLYDKEITSYFFIKNNTIYLAVFDLDNLSNGHLLIDFNGTELDCNSIIGVCF